MTCFIKDGIGLDEGIEFAEKYQAFELLCTYIYEAGKEYYEHIHEGYNKWGMPFL